MIKREKEEIKLAKLILNGYILEKTVRKFGSTSGAIFVPKKLIGKKFKVILIEKDELNEMMI